MKVSINDGSDWKTFPLKENSYFPGCNAVRFLLDGCLAEVADKKKSYLGSCLTFLGELCMRVGSRRVVL